MSPFSFGAALSPASSMLRSDGLRWKNKGHLISFGRRRHQPKHPPPPAAAAVYINERGEDIADFVFNAQNRAEDITLVRSMGFEVNDHPLSMGGHSWKGRSGGGIASITVQCCKAQCTMDQGLQMIGPPMAFPSLESSSTASLVAHLYNEDDGNGRAATCK